MLSGLICCCVLSYCPRLYDHIGVSCIVFIYAIIIYSSAPQTCMHACFYFNFNNDVISFSSHHDGQSKAAVFVLAFAAILHSRGEYWVITGCR